MVVFINALSPAEMAAVGAMAGKNWPYSVPSWLRAKTTLWTMRSAASVEAGMAKVRLPTPEERPNQVLRGSSTDTSSSGRRVQTAICGSPPRSTRGV